MPGGQALASEARSALPQAARPVVTADFPVPSPGAEPADVVPLVPLPAAPLPLPVPATGPVPVRFLPRAIAPELVIQRFRLGPKVTEFMVVLHASDLEGVRLRTPAGQIISADNIWRVGRWQAGQQLSVISLDWSAAGEWQVLAPRQVAVDVIVDPMLVPVSTPDTVGAGQPALLRWQVQAAGRALDLSSLAELVVAAARVVDERGAITDLAYSFDPNGIVSLTVPAQAAGVLTVQTDIWLATFGQHVIHRLAIVPEPTVQVLGRRAAPLLIVRVPDAGLDTRSTRVVLDIRASDGARQVVVGRRAADGGFRLQVPAGALGERPELARVVLGIDGLTRGRQPWHAPSRIVTLGTQGLAATRVLVDAPAASGKRAAGHAAAGAESGAGAVQGGDSAAAAHAMAGSAHADGSGSDAVGHWTALLLHPSRHGPQTWHYAALATANLVLLVLFWLRHRQKRRGSEPPATSATATAAAVAAAAIDTGDAAGHSMRRAADGTSGSAPGVSAAVPGGAAAAGAGEVAGMAYDDRMPAAVGAAGARHTNAHDAAGPDDESPATSREEPFESLDLDALDSLAALAETRSEARSMGGNAPPDDDEGDVPPDAARDDDVEAAA